MDIKAKLASEFSIKPEYSSNIVDLIEEGNTIPFIARYRKEMHGACDDQVLREFADRLTYLQNLQKRKEEVKASIESQDKWTDDLAVALEKAETLTEVEDIYRPYKQKKQTRAMVAISKGLEPLADIIMAQELKECNIDELANQYVHIDEENPKLSVETAEDAINGAKDIIAERVSDNAECRKKLRELYFDIGNIKTKLLESSDKNKDKLATYELYKEFDEKIKTIPSHRVLAVNRGEKDECLKVDIDVAVESAIKILNAEFLKDSAFNQIMNETIADSYERLIAPSIEREVRSELTEKANEQAIKMFEINLRPLLLQPPLKGKVILGLDPGYRTGCKVAVIDKQGNLVDDGVVYLTHSENQKEQAKKILTDLVNKHSVDVISIGNGTASKETEIFVANLIKDLDRSVSYIVVNEAGASVYSASKLGAEEFPDKDVTIRGAVSIARRLLDPLAELIKIDVKSIGIGQYQHDMPQKRLTEVLDGVVEDCVNSVGVDLNTASYSLLSFVSGLNTSIAKNIVKHREKEPFSSREQLKKVSKLGPKAYEQCAGFLRIPTSKNIFDNTAVHPESYDAAKKLLQILGYDDANLDKGLSEIKQKVLEYGQEKAARECGIGVPTLVDIVEELSKPGRDVRDSLPTPLLRDDLMDVKDLKEGMELVGTVRNVIDFGAFVDIGMHHDGLVHISEISDKFVRHPMEVLTVGQIVKVRVIGVDPSKGRINLSMRTPGLAKPAKKTEEEKAKEREQFNKLREQNKKKDFQNKNNNNRPNGFNREYRDKNTSSNANFVENASVEEMLIALQNKYKR